MDHGAIHPRFATDNSVRIRARPTSDETPARLFVNGGVNAAMGRLTATAVGKRYMSTTLISVAENELG